MTPSLKWTFEAGHHNQPLELWHILCLCLCCAFFSFQHYDKLLNEMVSEVILTMGLGIVVDRYKFGTSLVYQVMAKKIHPQVVFVFFPHYGKLTNEMVSEFIWAINLGSPPNR